MQLWADWATERWHVEPVVVKIVRGSFKGKHIADCGDGKIRLRKNAGNVMPVLLHEVAHHICDMRYDDEVQGHGPEFVAVLRDLFHASETLDKVAWDALCKKHGVKRARIRRPR
jgi:hypothetical protein